MPILDGAQAALETLCTGFNMLSVAQATAEAKQYADLLVVEGAAEGVVFTRMEMFKEVGSDYAINLFKKLLSPRMVTRVFRKYAEKAKLPTTVRLHDLRHTAITNAIGQGEDIMLVAASAGHAKTSTTIDVYGHLMPKRAQDAARRMRSVSGSPPPSDQEAAPA